MKISKKLYFAVTLTAILLPSCSSYQENNTAFDFETIEIPITNEISFTDAEREINNEINIFGIHTFSKIVIAKPNENIAYSPISALMAISVYHYGDKATRLTMIEQQLKGHYTDLGFPSIHRNPYKAQPVMDECCYK